MGEMDEKIYEKLIEQGGILIEQIIKKIDRTFLWIRKSAPVLYNGERGVVIWDAGIWNEITFVSMDGNIAHSLFTKFSDRETEDEFNRLINTYGQLANEGIYDEIIKLRGLFDMGAISEEEFGAKKDRLFENL